MRDHPPPLTDRQAQMQNQHHQHRIQQEEGVRQAYPVVPEAPAQHWDNKMERRFDDLRMQVERDQRDMAARLARIETRIDNMASEVGRLATRDSELDASVRNLAQQNRDALTQQAVEFRNTVEKQADTFSKSMKEVTSNFVAKEEWSFWKNLLTIGLMALIGLGWNTLTK